MKLRLVILLLVIKLFVLQCTYAQFSFLEDVNSQITLEFINQKIETNVNKSFFNAVIIKNPTNRSTEFIAKFSIPGDWSFIGEKEHRVSLQPNDSIIIPFRAAASINTKGEIGYSIVASLSDLKGNTFTNEYSFVTIPRERNVIVKPIEKVYYIDQQTNKSEIRYYLANNGNTEEEYYFTFKLGETLVTDRSVDGILKKEFFLDPYTDTIIRIPLTYLKKKNYYNKRFHPVYINTNLKDSSINNIVWLKNLESVYENFRDPSYDMFDIEIISSNALSNSKSVISGYLIGSILFKSDQDIKYRVYGSGERFLEDPYKYGKYYLRYRFGKFQATFGDINTNSELNVYGRGGKLYYKTNKDRITLFTSKSVLKDRINTFAHYARDINKNFRIGTGASYSIDNFTERDEALISLNSIYNIDKFGSINGTIGFSQFNLQDTSNYTPPQGIGAKLNIDGTLKDFTLSLRGEYGSKQYAGIIRGRFNLNTTINYFLSKKQYLTFKYFHNYNSPQAFNSRYYRVTNNYTNNDELLLLYNKYINNNLLLGSGLLNGIKSGNSFWGFSQEMDVKTLNNRVYFNTLYRNRNHNVNFTFQGGYNTVIQYPNEIIDTLVANDTSDIYTINKNWIGYNFRLYYKFSFFNLSMQYENGPRTISQQFLKFTRGANHNLIRIFPYIDYYVIPKYLQVVSKLSYSRDITDQVNRLNFINEVYGYPGYGFRLGLLATYNYQSNVDNVTEELYRYSAYYFEFKVKKSIGVKQPRFQYHNLDIVFFKDLNGNRVKDKNEPGLRDVLVTVKKDDEFLSANPNNASRYFMEADMLSDHKGNAKYENIPNGSYYITYTPLAKMKGSYSSEETTQQVLMNENKTVYVPFFENNKIFGRVLLNRSKLSNLGQVDVSNIKVTAENSYGKKYTTLTDANGNYTIYVPNVDLYKVRVNNIFFENFELEQNDYQVQLNGYKQFEVNFIFNEKKRRINFTSSYDYGSRLDGPGVEIVRRTNLTGSIKDATTLKPLVANIKVIDNNGNEVTRTKSSLKTGIFTTSFVAGDGYTIEIEADDYWFHSENLYSQQLVTFKNLKKDILLKGITVGSLIPMQTLNFQSASYEIPATSFPELDRLMAVLKKNPSVKIAVHGHADDLEILESETDLALERAKLVAKYLIASGYNRVKYVGHSNTKPIADNDTEDGRKQNRRVEIVVTGK